MASELRRTTGLALLTLASGIPAFAVNPGETGGFPNELLGIGIIPFTLIVLGVLVLFFLLKFRKGG